MKKRTIYFVFLAFAQLILLGHNIIPHQHHDSFEHFLISDNFFNHHSHDHVQKLDLGHLDFIFSFVPHGETGMEFMSCPTMDDPVQKQFFQFESDLIAKIELLIHFPIKGTNHTAFEFSIFNKISELLPDNLRAPPSQV